MGALKENGISGAKRMREREEIWGRQLQKVKARVKNRWAARNFYGVHEQKFDLQHSHCLVRMILKRNERFDVQYVVKLRSRGEMGLGKQDQGGSWGVSRSKKLES